MPNMDITCEECQAVFTLTDEQQAYYTDNGYTLPTRCDACEQRRKDARAAEKAAKRPRRRPRR